ncbi:MAG: FAD-binding oxidoreductase [Alphaproteobacteria bacterium]|nr:FAD-binding oxidoreductase [Alphaproteobacteria bacterium]
MIWRRRSEAEREPVPAERDPDKHPVLSNLAAIGKISTDVLVIGGGGAGCSAALHIAERGVRVTLLERGLVGSQASGVNYGGVRQQGRHPAELPIARRSRELWGRLREITGSDCEFVPSGHLKLARNAEEEAELVAYADVARQYDLPLRLIGRNAVHAEFPFLGPAVVAGSFAADDGHANPRLLAPALARAARKAGAAIVEHAEVVRLARDSDGFIAETANGLEVRAKSLVNTAGYWGGAIAEQFGEKVPIQVLAPNMIVTEPLPYVVKVNLGVVGGNVYLRQIARGNVIFGGGHGEADPVALRARPLPAITLEALPLAAEIVPMLRDALVIRSWTGMDGQMPDHIPVIGPSRTTPGLFHAFGFSGHGFQLGPAIGAILGELVLDGRSGTPIEAFDIGRFTLGKPP